MKNFLFLILLLLITLSGIAQDNVYQQLYKHYPGLKQESVTLITEREKLTKAYFMYKGRKRVAYFNDDSSIAYVKRIITEKELPLNIQKDIHCIFRTYNVVEVALWQNMENGVFKPERNYTVVFGKPGAEYGEALVYLNGVRPTDLESAILQTGDYEVNQIARLGIKPCSGENWYLGSGESFAADMQRAVQFQNDSCINRFIGTTYTLKMEIERDGGIGSWEIYGLTPYALDLKVKEYFLGVRFPEQKTPDKERGYCRWAYQLELTISDKGKIIVRALEGN